MRANRGEVERMSLPVKAVDVMTTGRAPLWAVPSNASKRLMSRSLFAAGDLLEDRVPGHDAHGHQYPDPRRHAKPYAVLRS